MGRIVTEASGPDLVAAVEANLAEHFALFGRLPGATMYDGSEMMWVATAASRPVPNGVYRTRLPSGGIDARVGEVLEVFASHRIGTIDWVCGPSTQPADLGECLRARGFSQTRVWVGMAIDLASAELDIPVPPDVAVEEVVDMRGLATWLDVFRASSGHPEAGVTFFKLFSSVGLGRELSTRHYVGRLKGEPVGRTTLAFAGGVAGIHWVATAPQARRKGVASALVLAALCDAREAGHRFAVLHSTQMALGTYRRIGFQELCALYVYDWRSGP